VTISKKGWEVANPTKCYTKCQHIEDNDKHDIIFSHELWLVIKAMLKRYDTCEWQMALLGKVKKDQVFCEGYYIPKQKVSMSSVKHIDAIDKEFIETHGVVAMIHSHVNMGVTPSTTDIDDSVMSLIDYHVIINNKYEVCGIRKAKLPCKALTTASCEVLVEGLDDLDSVVIEGTENIEREYYQGAGTPVIHGAGVGSFYNRFKNDEKPPVSYHNDWRGERKLIGSEQGRTVYDGD
jgi:hypothetical protein